MNCELKREKTLNPFFYLPVPRNKRDKFMQLVFFINQSIKKKWITVESIYTFSILFKYDCVCLHRGNKEIVKIVLLSLFYAFVWPKKNWKVILVGDLDPT